MEITSIEIRIATLSDIKSIASVLKDSFVAYESSYTPEAFAMTTPAAEQIRTRLTEGPVWVAVQNDALAGTVSGVPMGEGFYIRSMAVLPATRGKGIGLLLLKVVETFAVSHRFRRLLLSTTPFLRSAIRLYEEWGFRKSDEGPHELFGTPLFTMVKYLDLSNPKNQIMTRIGLIESGHLGK